MGRPSTVRPRKSIRRDESYSRIIRNIALTATGQGNDQFGVPPAYSFMAETALRASSDASSPCQLFVCWANNLFIFEQFFRFLNFTKFLLLYIFWIFGFLFYLIFCFFISQVFLGFILLAGACAFCVIRVKHIYASVFL